MEQLGSDDPRRIGAYRLLGRLGSGGMGRVYLARSDRGRTVAVKLVQAELAQQPEFRRRFQQEVDAARRVGGEWTAPVLDADTEAATPWVATGYVAGPSLSSVVARSHGPLPERSVRILAHGLAQALGAIHEAGLIHRDLKPSNVLVTIDGPRVIDFGIARALDAVTENGLTRSGAVVGSPGYMSPEQVRGERLTPASDLFCLGSVLAFAATGRPPFGTPDIGVHALMFRIAEEQPDLAGLSEGLRPLVESCLAKEPADRPSLAEVWERTAEEAADSRREDGQPWLPGALVAQLGRHAVQLLDSEDPESVVVPPAPAAPPPVAPPPPAVPAPPPAAPPPATPPRMAPPPPAGPPTAPPPPAVPAPPAGPPATPPRDSPAAETPAARAADEPAAPQQGTECEEVTVTAERRRVAPEAVTVPQERASEEAERPGWAAAPPQTPTEPDAAAGPREPAPRTPEAATQPDSPPAASPAPEPAPSPTPQSLTEHDEVTATGQAPLAAPEAKTTPVTVAAAAHDTDDSGTVPGDRDGRSGGRRRLVVALAAALGVVVIGVGAAVTLWPDGSTPRAQDDTGAKNDRKERADTTRDSSPDSSPSPDTPTSSPEGVLPPEYLGVWEGDTTRDGERTGTVRRIEVRQGTEGSLVATTTFLNTDNLCVEEATLTRFDRQLAVLESDPVEGVPSTGCNSSSEQTLKLLPDGRTLVWSNPDARLEARLTRAQDTPEVPQDLVGTWQGALDTEWDSDYDDDTFTLEVREGASGETVATWSAESNNRSCEWESTMLTVRGGSLLLGPGELVAAVPEDSCDDGDVPGVTLAPRSGDKLVVSPVGTESLPPLTFRRGS